MVFDEIIKGAKQQAKDGNFRKSFADLQGVDAKHLDFTCLQKIVNLFRKIEPQLLTESNLPKVKLYLLSSATLDHLVDALPFFFAVEGYSLEVRVAGFGTIEQQIYDPASELYQFEPDIVWIFSGYKDIESTIDQRFLSGDTELVSEITERYTSLWRAIQERINPIIINNNFEGPKHQLFGNFETSFAESHCALVRSVNEAMVEHAGGNLVVFDIDAIAAYVGKRSWFDERFWYHSKHPFSMDYTGLVAHRFAKLIRGIKGRAYKCVVLDLDNTLWGGVIADDGLEGIRLGAGVDGEAFVDFQRYILRLKERGIILAVCSKNDEDNAKLPFLCHPDMQIKLDDIAMFVANWVDKASNVAQIAKSLSIGIDSLVFVDDNPVERQIIKDFLPEVCVPELPVDPAKYIDAIDSLNLFETISFGSEDKQRNLMYRQNVQRDQLKGTVASLDDFLASLQMKSVVSGLTDFNLPRIAQLINKSNQFHLTTTRYNEATIRDMVEANGYLCRSFTLEDKFGDNGLISVVLLQVQGTTLYIDTWVMSCRVLSRGVEEFIAAEIFALAEENGLEAVVGKYLPTSKNKLVAKLYERLGFELIEEEMDYALWRLDVAAKQPCKTYIKRVSGG